MGERGNPQGVPASPGILRKPPLSLLGRNTGSSGWSPYSISVPPTPTLKQSRQLTRVVRRARVGLGKVLGPPGGKGAVVIAHTAIVQIHLWGAAAPNPGMWPSEQGLGAGASVPAPFFCSDILVQ